MLRVAPQDGLVYPRAFGKTGESPLAAAASMKTINWTNAITLISVAILVGTELVGAAAAAGWAIGGLFQLGETITHALQGVFVLAALTGLYYFLRAALAQEPIRT
jgi:hypothetical protein